MTPILSARRSMSLVSAIAAGMLALQACGSGDDSNGLFGPSPAAVTFSGRIVDFVTQAPIASVSVAFSLDPQQPGTSATTTNADGQYTLTVSHTGPYSVRVDGTFAGQAHVNGSGYRGDLFVSRGTCVSRYGLVIDRRTLRPINGATVELGPLVVGRATSGADGWYRLDLGCPDRPQPGGNTTFLTVRHGRYEEHVQPYGRGVLGVMRQDLLLTPR